MWSRYNGADGNQYWFDPDTGQFVPMQPGETTGPGTVGQVMPAGPQVRTPADTGMSAGMGIPAPTPRDVVPTTPGISLGVGQVRGPGAPAPIQSEQRRADPNQSLFPQSDNRNLQDIYYDTPGNWGDAWGQVVSKLGGQVGSNYYKFLQGYSGTAKTAFQNNAQQTGGNGHVINYLNDNAPGYADIFHSLTSSQRGENPGYYTAGRALY